MTNPIFVFFTNINRQHEETEADLIAACNEFWWSFQNFNYTFSSIWCLWSCIFIKVTPPYNVRSEEFPTMSVIGAESADVYVRINSHSHLCKIA